jgi:anti-sigma factor RsiW
MAGLSEQLSAEPAWGGGHIALDAIVAYVDEELSPGAQRRALRHLSTCSECANEVVAQTQARLALRASSAPCMPMALLRNLQNIPSHAPLPEPPAGLAVGPDGELVSMLREPKPPAPRKRRTDRRSRLGAGAVVSGIALGALVVAGQAGSPTQASPSNPRGSAPRAALDSRQQFGGAASLSSPLASTPRVDSVLLDRGAATPMGTMGTMPRSALLAPWRYRR